MNYVFAEQEHQKPKKEYPFLVFQLPEMSLI